MGRNQGTIVRLTPARLIPAMHVFGNVVGLTAGWAFASSDSWTWYLLGQVILAMVLVHAFVVLHEAGHGTLFKNQKLNRVVGHYSGFLAVIPFASWRTIHDRHHRFTGWQDLDATTATLVPRALKPWETVAVNIAWKTWLPLFSILYRLQNYWLLLRLRQFIDDPSVLKKIRLNVIVMLSGYIVLVWIVGFWDIVSSMGPALLLCLMVQDVLLLSQHTHIPQHLSKGEAVKPFSPEQQVQFSRSLRLPSVISSWLMRFDAHELHHMYPAVPGYLLYRIDRPMPNDVPWFVWVRQAKRLSGVDFLFRNRDDTGASV